MFPNLIPTIDSNFTAKMRSITDFTVLAALSASLTTTLCANIPSKSTSPLPNPHHNHARDSFNNKLLSPRNSTGRNEDTVPQLNKPEISPAFSEATQDRDLRTEMPYHKWHYEEWNEYWIPETCLQEAEYNKLSGDDFDVRTVWYDDCAAPWVICRHRVAREPWESILTILGQVPVGMRQYLANLIILPSSSGSQEMTNAAAYTRGAVMVFTPSYFKLGVLFHEFSHILDTISLSSYIVSQGLGKPGTPFSETSIWRSAYNNDTHVPTAYARMTFQEDFADVGRWGMSDFVHGGGGGGGRVSGQASSYSGAGGTSLRGGYGGSPSQRVKTAGGAAAAAGNGQAQVGAGLRSYSSGWEGCKWQINCFKRFLGPVIFTRTGRCTGKVRSGVPVPVPGALGRVMVGSGVGTKLPPGMADEKLYGDAGVGVDEEEENVGDIEVPESVGDEVHVYRGPAPGNMGY